jgi:hypothetical protein
MRFILRFKLIIVLVIILGSLAACGQPEVDEQTFYNTYVAHAFDALNNPAAANARVFSIWSELVFYSKHMFPIYPAEQFTLGHATMVGIYLDLSVVADPNLEVTRFWLAHEWGHMMHGDPLNQLTALGQYRALMGGTSVEDDADTYAATFMRYQDHDIKPVLDFLCSLPGGGGADAHRTGPERAIHVARIYSVPDKDIKAPCEPKEDEQANRATLVASIRAMAETSKTHIPADPTVQLSFGGFNQKCEIIDDPHECDYVLPVTDQSQVDTQFDKLASAIDDAVPSWKRHDDTHDTSRYPRLPRRETFWMLKIAVDSPSIDLELRKNSDSGDEFLVLTFTAPDNGQ